MGLASIRTNRIFLGIRISRRTASTFAGHRPFHRAALDEGTEESRRGHGDFSEDFGAPWIDKRNERRL